MLFNLLLLASGIATRTIGKANGRVLGRLQWSLLRERFVISNDQNERTRGLLKLSLKIGRNTLYLTHDLEPGGHDWPYDDASDIKAKQAVRNVVDIDSSALKGAGKQLIHIAKNK